MAAMEDVGENAFAGTASAAVNPCHEQESMIGDKIVLKEFILNLESMPEVWNSAHVNYKNTILKNEALKKLLTIYKRIKSDATIDDIKKKINSLRSNYRKELKKIVDSKRSGAGSGDVYQPKSWVFHLLHFLSKTEQPVAPSAPVSSVGSQEVDQFERQEGDTSEQSSGAFSSLNVPTPPNPKKKKGPIAKQNELLDKACSFLSQNVDQALQNTPSVNPTALYWSSKLDKLDPIQKYYAERFINDILLEAELGNLTRNSVHIKSFVRDDITTSSPAHSPYVYNPPTPSQMSNSLISAPTPSPPPVNVVTSQGNTNMAPIYIVNSSTSTNSSATGFTSQLLMQKSVKPVMLQRQEERMNYQQFHGNNVNNTLQLVQRPQEHISDQQLHANNNISENAFHQADYNDVRDGRQPSNQDATLSALFSSFTDI